MKAMKSKEFSDLYKYWLLVSELYHMDPMMSEIVLVRVWLF